MTEAAAPTRRGGVDRKTYAECRRLYEMTDTPRREIASRMGVQPGSLSRIATRDGWAKAGPAERRAIAVRRIREKVERQILKVDEALRVAGGAAADREARTLTSLVRSLRELQRLDAETGRGARHEDADDAPADPDALRSALAERLARLRQEYD